ncbi:MAG: hypothetical protein AAF664_25015, partial [Planctomycetota bacterium]
MSPSIRILIFCTLIVGVLMVLANLPMQLTVVQLDGGLRAWPGESNFHEDALALPVAAGFPMRFYERFDDLPDAEPYRWWSTSRLLLNLLITLAAIISLFLLCLLIKRQRKGRSPESTAESEETPAASLWQRLRKQPVQLSIFDLIMATSVIGLVFGGYQWLKRFESADAALATSLGPDASYAREAILPRVIDQWAPDVIFPSSLKALLQRTTCIRLHNPSDDQVRTALAFPQLRALAIGGGDFDLESLGGLPQHRSITALHLMGRVLDDRTLSRLRLLPNLRDLNLARTNLSAAAFAKLFEGRDDDASRLVALKMFDSGVDLAALSQNGVLSKLTSLESLWLPRPLPDQASKLSLSSMPRLQDVHVISYDRMKNNEPIAFMIEDCPRLQSINIDSLQKASFKLSNLPQLVAITQEKFKTSLRLAANQRAPEALWVESMDVDGLPALEQFTFYASDLRHLHFRGTPNWELAGPGVFQLVPNGYLGTNQYDTEVPAEATRAFIEGLSKSDGPQKIDYSAVPLAGADLKPLLDNSAVQELYLHQCGVTEKQLASLSGSSQLKVISSHGGKLSGRRLGKLVTSMPGLRRWHADLYQIDRLRVEDHANLKGVVDCYPESNSSMRCHLSSAFAVRLVNLPNWEDPIRLDAAQFRHLTIDNLPRLKQLVIDGPVCQDAVIKHLTGLEKVAAGGKFLDDEIIEEWFGYDALHSIRLYGTSVTS